ncbi:MAG: hypothetical protein IPH06_05320 [Alphaproteobacteria bacterium]|nr:hypothetical protein [Alphaproteobacteria bacterium]QQS57442.1 MAG: hypothetical protein IPN28_01085 [Alphaproteobacteria bacterium]
MTDSIKSESLLALMKLLREADDDDQATQANIFQELEARYGNNFGGHKDVWLKWFLDNHTASSEEEKAIHKFLELEIEFYKTRQSIKEIEKRVIEKLKSEGKIKGDDP